MKYFIDTEFIEGFKKPFFGRRRHFIDLISIGIVAEDGRTYYAISNEFDPRDADKWVKQNVLQPLLTEWIQSYSGDQRNYVLDMTESRGLTQNIFNLQTVIGKSNDVIAKEIIDFVRCPTDTDKDGDCAYHLNGCPAPEFWGYYSDYDWVLFCSLFGRMIDLPKGFPMYCRDLKQLLDEKQSVYNHLANKLSWVATESNGFHDLKKMPAYPKQDPKSAHNALADAQWNKELYAFLKHTRFQGIKS